jgi:superoxide dismutase, Cu-Zn family
MHNNYLPKKIGALSSGAIRRRCPWNHVKKAAAGLALAAALAANMTAPADAAPRLRAMAKLIGLDGAVLGKADFRQVARGILIEIDAHGLPPGAHAVMIHTTASCDPKTRFTSAGPDLDFDPPRPHGFLVTGGPRPGDLPNQFAGADGTLHVTLHTTYFSLGGGKRTIFDRDGASIIIHAKADDYLTAPDGGAGERIACGTIIRTVGPKLRSPRPAGKR